MCCTPWCGSCAAVQEVKISKRAGSYVTLRDLIEWTSKDAVRFFLLSRKPDTEYVFDVDLAVVQKQRKPGLLRAVRPCPDLHHFENLGDPKWPKHSDLVYDADLSALGPAQQAQSADVAAGALYPEMLTQACHGQVWPRTTSRFTCVIWPLASHSYYDAERILVDDDAVKLARLALVAATAQVLHNGLAVLGVSAPIKM